VLWTAQALTLRILQADVSRSVDLPSGSAGAKAPGAPVGRAPGGAMASGTMCRMSDDPFAAPTPLDEPTARFVTVSNVLAGIRNYDHGGLLDSELHRKVATSVLGRGRSPQPLRTIGRDEKRLLRIAWQTELAARVTDEYDDEMLRRVGAQTLPVQAYYAIFNAARALTSIAGTACDNHAKVQSDYEGVRAQRGYRSWSVRFAGDPVQVNTCTVTPAVAVPMGFNLMEQWHDDVDYLLAGLRMAHKWRLEKKREEWLAHKANRRPNGQPYKRLPSGKAATLAAGMRASTVLDLLYGLRVRTNYLGVEEYGSNASDQDVTRFHRGLLHLTDTGLMHYESLIAQQVGLPALEAEAQAWMTTVGGVGPWATKALQQRLTALWLASP
jgi:hypothetical protein